MKASIVHPLSIIAIVPLKNPNQVNPNTSKRLSTLEKAGWSEYLWKKRKTSTAQCERCFVPGHCSTVTSHHFLSLCPEQQPSSPMFEWCGVHCYCWDTSPGVHSKPSADLEVVSLSLVGWPNGHHHHACLPAHSGYPGVPQETQAYNGAAACSEGSSDDLCPDLYTIVFSVTPPGDQGHSSLDVSDGDLNGAYFMGSIGSAMCSGCFAARRDDWTLAAVSKVPCDFRHSQDL